MSFKCSCGGDDLVCSSIVVPSDFGGFHDYEILCRVCGRWETVGYLSRENVVIEIPLSQRRIASLRPKGTA
jgi:hypothetical protein